MLVCSRWYGGRDGGTEGRRDGGREGRLEGGKAEGTERFVDSHVFASLPPSLPPSLLSTQQYILLALRSERPFLSSAEGGREGGRDGNDGEKEESLPLGRAPVFW